MKVIIRSSIALTLILVTALAFVFFGPIKLSHADSVTTLSSQNYAGWADRNGKFTSVAGSWVVPSVKCTKKNQALGIWVGIGGLTSQQDLEQDGVIIVCDTSHHAQYVGFYEILPAVAQILDGPVQPGDHFSASVNLVRKGLFNFQLHDITQGWSFTHQGKKSGAHLASAECIVEAISDNNNHIEPLVKFNTINISGCRENGNPIGAGPSVLEIFMLSQRTGAFKAKPSDLSANGTAFSVQWGQS
jgi:hypothetical protein